MNPYIYWFWIIVLIYVAWLGVYWYAPEEYRVLQQTLGVIALGPWRYGHLYVSGIYTPLLTISVLRYRAFVAIP